MEILLAVGIVSLAALGLGLGVMKGRPPLSGSCGSTGCVPGATCDDCPNRRMAAEENGR